MQKNNKRKIWNVIFIIALVGCIACVGFTGWYFWQRHQYEQNYQKMMNEVVDNQQEQNAEVLPEYQTSESETSEEPSSEAQTSDAQDSGSQASESQTSDAANADTIPTYTMEEIENTEFTGIIDAPAPPIPSDVLTEIEDRPIDFEKLNEINPELYAWIRIPKTNIDYPVAQHEGEDQQYYLHRDMYQEPQFAGCIYSEAPNRKDFKDPVTVLYGHNMKNGSMFQNLYLFRNQDFFDQNKYVYIYTKDEAFVYEIYAAYMYDDHHILKSFDFSKAEDFEKYIEESQHPRSMEALVRDGVKITTDDHILTLSTCVANQPELRLLVQAVLSYEKDEQPNAEQAIAGQ